MIVSPKVPGGGRSALVSDDAAPEALGPPDARAQSLQLNDLAVVHEEVYLGAVVLDVPGEHLRVGGLEHDLLQPHGVDDPGHDAGAPGADVLRDPLRLDHDLVGPGLQEA